MHGKLETWKELIKTNFHGQDVPYDIYSSATAVLKRESVYKVKTIIRRYMLKIALLKKARELNIPRRNCMKTKQLENAIKTPLSGIRRFFLV